MAEATTCERCKRGSMHYPRECSEPCVDGEHDIESYYRNYGYFRASCSKCHRIWEVDSSG